MTTPSARTETRGALAPALLALALLGCGDERGAPVVGAEYPAPGEAAITRELIELTQASSLAARESGATAGILRRFNQPRQAGCVKAEFSVRKDLPAELRVGLFAQPGSWPAWIRFASATNAPDTEKDFRGMSIKVVGARMETLYGDGEGNLDFVLNSHPALFVGTPEDFRDFVATGLERNPAWFFLSPLDLHLKELNIVRKGRQHHSSHLDIPYWSTTPYAFGEGRAVKYSARPCPGHVDHPLPDPLYDGYLRAALRDQLAAGEACFDFMVQFQLDAEQMPVEDASVAWDEVRSPFRAVAQIRIPAQAFESTAQMGFCENLAFNPWRAPAEHRPLGGINRARKDLYQALAQFRHAENGVAYTEPDGDEHFP